MRGLRMQVMRGLVLGQAQRPAASHGRNPSPEKIQMANSMAKNDYFQITCIVIIINDMKIIILSYREEHTYLFWHLV